MVSMCFCTKIFCFKKVEKLILKKKAMINLAQINLAHFGKKTQFQP